MLNPRVTVSLLCMRVQPLAPDREHLRVKVQGDIHLKLTVQDVSGDE